ncbi:MAG: hypothetical protein RR846_00600 [Oscillospiraceae bacterium]
MLAVIDKYNLENMERVIDKQGCLTYQNEEGQRLVLEKVLFNESLGMSTQEIEEHAALIKRKESLYCKRCISIICMTK